MRIGIDCRLWNESGVGRYIRNLVERLLILDKRNQYVLFVLTKDENEMLKQVQHDKKEVQNDRDQVRNENVKIVVADVCWHSFEEQLRFPSILNRENLDLVHFPYVSVPIFYNKPFVVTIHDLIPYHFPTGEASTLPLPLYKLKLLGYKFVIQQAAKKATKIITVSNATKREIVEHLKVPEGKVVVTHEGVEDNLSSKLKAQSSKPQLKTKSYFLYVGNAYPHKNLNRLIEAFDLLCHSSQAPPDQDDMKLVLVGRVDYFYKRLRQKVKDMGLERSVLFYGEATDGELSALYKNALALITPSLMEGFGLPALEAMANRCLVLSSDIPSFKEICGDAAIYFDPYDITDMAKKMIDTYHSNDSNHYRDKIKKGFNRAKMFSWEKMAKETLKIYGSCINL